MLRMSHWTRIAAVAVALLGAPVVDAAVGWNEARAEASEIAVGTQLMAVSDVTLHQAEISKGSRVSVTQLLVQRGKLQGVSLALADGHVVKVPMGTVMSFFQIVNE
jgi:hypothetical protein